MAYDRHAAGLYGYCHWMVHDAADAAGALQDTFVIAAATLSELPEPSRLRPWLFALARNECRRRIRTTSATRTEEPLRRTNGPMRRASRPTRPTGLWTRPCQYAWSASGPMLPVSRSTHYAAPGGQPGGPTLTDWLMDATMPFRVVSLRADASPEPIDATMPMRGGQPADRCGGRPDRVTVTRSKPNSGL